MINSFKKITTANGFDTVSSSNAMQNNYAWSMEEMDGFLYIGTGRNIFYTAITAASKVSGLNFQIPKELTPEDIDMRAEIWRYKMDGSQGWERVFKAPAGIMGFRFMIRYTTTEGETALYSGAFNVNPEVIIFKSSDGVNWKPLQSNIPGTSTRAMIIHGGKLYLSSVDEGNPELGAQIFSSVNPEKQGWISVTGSGNPEKNPNGQVSVLASFNNHIYAGVNRFGGFELWRTEGFEPKIDEWKLVIDQGAGDAANEIPLTLGVFKEHLYIGAIIFPLTTQIRVAAIKPFDLIRIDKNDRWELVIGGAALESTNTTTGTRNAPLSLLPSGAGNFSNLYCWSLKEYKGEFFMGTFDWSVLLFPLLRANQSLLLDRVIPENSKLAEKTISSLVEKITEPNLLTNALTNTFGGFDLYRSNDGINWQSINLNGLGNPHNYGARNLFVSSNGTLFLGTANVFDGCEVWIKQSTSPFFNLSKLNLSWLTDSKA